MTLMTNPTFSIGHGPPIKLVAAAYCDGMRIREPRCSQCGRRLGREQRNQCGCGFLSTPSIVADYYVEPCFIELDWLVYERDFAPLIAPLHLVSDLVALTFHIMQEDEAWTDLCDGCKFSSHELDSLSRAIPRDFIKLHFSSGQIYWGNEHKTLNQDPHKFGCVGSPQ